MVARLFLMQVLFRGSYSFTAALSGHHDCRKQNTVLTSAPELPMELRLIAKSNFKIARGSDVLRQNFGLLREALGNPEFVETDRLSRPADAWHRRQSRAGLFSQVWCRRATSWEFRSLLALRHAAASAAS